MRDERKSLLQSGLLYLDNFMTLRAKTISSIVVSLALLLTAVFGLIYSILLNQSNLIEEKEIETALNLGRKALQVRSVEFSEKVKRLSQHPECYQLATATSTTFPIYLNSQFQETQNLYSLLVLNKRGQLVWAKNSNSTNPQLASSTLITHLQRQPNLKRRLSLDSAYSGLFEFDNKALELISLPIYAPPTEESKNNCVGNLMAVRLWTSQSPNANELQPEFAILPLSGGLQQQLGRNSPFATSYDSDFIRAYTPINDINGRTKWALEVKVPYHAPLHNRNTFIVLVSVLALGGIACCLLAIYPIEKFVVNRVSKLSHEIQAVRDSSNDMSRVEVEGNDELTLLAQNINSTLESLEQVNFQKTRSETLHREMAQTALAAGDCFFVWEANSDTMHWIGEVDSLLGYSDGTFPRSVNCWQEHIHPEDRPVVLRAYRHAFENKKPFELEIRVHRADKQILHWMHRGNVVVDNAECKLLGACLDITERKRIEAARQRTEARLARIVETATDAIVLFDVEGVVMFANDAAVRMFGRTVEELWGYSHDSPAWNCQSLDGEALKAEETVFARVKKENKPIYAFECMMGSGNEQNIVVSVNASPLPDESGEFSGVVASFTDISERLRLQEELTHQAFHDTLTGLPNRALMRNRIEHSIASAQRSGTQLGLLFIDLDNFKWVNDSLGHEAGDDLLKEVANRLRQGLRQGDTAARFGGDEFVVLLKSLENPHYSVSVAQRLVDVISQPFQIAGREVFTTPSVGLAFSDDQSDVDTMLRHADAAMYEAKRRGKGRYEVFQENLSVAAMQRLDMESDLRRALQNHELSLVYQPEFDLKTGDISVIEALIRWNHPTRGEVSPAQFIPLAEETGLIVSIGQFALQVACCQAQEWNVERHKRQLKPLKIAVNISYRQIHTGATRGGTNQTGKETLTDALIPELALDIEQVLKSSGLPASQLILEITESVLMDRTQTSLEILSALRKIGTKLAIDDFGTGYSSLAYLRAFPFDYLKIDREFISHIDADDGPGLIVSSIISLAHALNLHVIAEGTERAEEVETLLELGCDMAQGYYFSKPLPSEELEYLILTAPSF